MTDPASSEPARVWPALVIGAGPAGAAAAARLAAVGHDVLLVDRHAFPRDKACGDGLIPDSLAYLRREGLYDDVVRAGFPAEEASVFSPARHEVRLRGEFVVLKRLELDHLLVRNALRRGARLHRARVSGLALENGAVRADVDRGEPIRARVAIVATGADVSLLRDLAAVRRPDPCGVAIRRYVRSPLPLDRLVVSYDKAILPGYAWIFPVGGGEYNVGCGIANQSRRDRFADLRAVLDRFLAEFPLARELAGEAEEVGPVRGARLRTGLGGVEPLVGGRVLVAGEAIATTYPFTGEGIGKAMETAEIAAELCAEALADDDLRPLAAYPDRLEALRFRYYGYELAERWLGYAAFNNLLARRARRSRFMRQALEGIVNETVDPRHVISLRGLVRSFFR